MCHGHRVVPLGDDLALGALRRRLGVDLLLSAGTGAASIRISGPGLLIDPGSITGAMCSYMASGLPSYTLMSLDHGKVRRAVALALLVVATVYHQA
jgi:predicted phosphodiesterase